MVVDYSSKIKFQSLSRIPRTPGIIIGLYVNRNPQLIERRQLMNGSNAHNSSQVRNAVQNKTACRQKFKSEITAAISRRTYRNSRQSIRIR